METDQFNQVMLLLSMLTALIAVLTLWASVSIPYRQARQMWYREVSAVLSRIDSRGEANERPAEYTERGPLGGEVTYLDPDSGAVGYKEIGDALHRRPPGVPRKVAFQLIEFQSVLRLLYTEKGFSWERDLSPILTPLKSRLIYEEMAWYERLESHARGLKYKKADRAYRMIHPTPRVSLTPRVKERLAEKREAQERAWARMNGR